MLMVSAIYQKRAFPLFWIFDRLIALIKLIQQPMRPHCRPLNLLNQGRQMSKLRLPILVVP